MYLEVKESLMEPLGDTKRSSLRRPRRVLIAAICNQFQIVFCVIRCWMNFPKACVDFVEVLRKERMHWEVVEDVGELEDVPDLKLGNKRVGFENKMRVGSKKSFRGRLDDGLETVADEKDVLETFRWPVCKEKIVGDLLRALKLHNECIEGKACRCFLTWGR